MLNSRVNDDKHREMVKHHQAVTLVPEASSYDLQLEKQTPVV